MKKNIDQFFKNKLDVPRKAPADSWDYIQNRLPDEEERGALPFWRKFMALGLILIFVGGTGLFIGKDILFTKNSEKQVSTKVDSSHPAISNQEIESETNRISSDHSTNSNSNQSSEFLDEFNSNHQNLNTQSLVINQTSNIYSTQNLNQIPIENHKIYQSNTNSNHSFIEIIGGEYQKNQDFDYPQTAQFIQSDLSVLLNQIDESSNQLLAVNHVKSNIKTNDEKKIKPKMDFDKFFVSGFVSPTALNTFVGRSMLSDDLNDYKTENNITLAYGVKAAYALSPKFRLRTGLSIVGFEQITKNVVLTTSFSEETRVTSGNINYSGDIRLFENGDEILVPGDLSYRISDGDVQQQSQFIEIPIEAEYAVFQTGSIGVSVTGGTSAWLLSKNRIYVQTEGHTEELGKADNLNNSWFSANAGLKFDLNVAEGVQFNVEPNFRYLMNPVNNVENYSPYTVGVNAGVTVKLK